jgi:hypothetical protein
MITLTIGSTEYEVSTGRLSLPRTGAWTADLLAMTDGPLTGSAILTASGVQMPAHIQRAEIVAGKLSMRLVGGAGGLGNLAEKKHYKGVTILHVLRDLLETAGETRAESTETAVLNTPLQAWTSLEVPIGALLQCLAETAGPDVTWRVLFDGTVWMGNETWPMCPADVRVIDADGANASQVLGTDSLGIWPGTTIAGRRVDQVVHEIGGVNRSMVYWAEAHL